MDKRDKEEKGGIVRRKKRKMGKQKKGIMPKQEKEGTYGTIKGKWRKGQKWEKEQKRVRWKNRTKGKAGKQKMEWGKRKKGQGRKWGERE